jgi:hypothetical protein
LLLVTLVLAVFAAGWAQSPRGSDSDPQAVIILLGPVAEWMYVRDEGLPHLANEALAELYIGSLDELRDSFDSPVSVVAAHEITRPIMSYETTHRGHPQQFVREARIDALLPSPADILRGDLHLTRLGLALGIPLLATDLVLPRRNETTLMRAMPLPSAAGTRVHLLATIDPTVVTVVPDLGSEVARSDEMLEQALLDGPEGATAVLLDAAQATWKRSGPDDANVENGTLRLPVPLLANHQIAIWRLMGLGAEEEPSASLEIVNLIPSDASPLLDQPALATFSVADSLVGNDLNRSVGVDHPFDSISEERRPASTIRGFPPRASNETVYIYNLYREQAPIQRVFGVNGHIGGLHRDISAVVATSIPDGQVKVHWIGSPVIGGREIAEPLGLEALIAEYGFEGLPPDPPLATGMEEFYAGLRELLRGASPVLESLEDLP